MRKWMAALGLIWLGACSSTLHNPGEQAAASAEQSGNCDAAKAIALPAAERGEPWAQYKLGSLLISCKPADAQKGLYWMARAASFESKTAWERGDASASGPAGFFDARRYATDSAQILHTIILAKSKPKDAWLMLAKLRRQYRPDETDYVWLSDSMKAIEQHVSQGTLDYWKAELDASAAKR